MQDYQAKFIEFLVKAKALQFGKYTLKSGRVSPYFFNTSCFNTGNLISELGYFYASAIKEEFPETNLIFGPAYKGIPLCIASSTAMYKSYNLDVGYVFDRKEAKTHGDKGILLGQIPGEQDRMVIVDDVITDGLTKKETIRLLRQITTAEVTGVLVAVDRMEKNNQGEDTIFAFEKEMDVPVKAIVTIDDICAHLRGKEIDGKIYMTEEIYQSIQEYLKQFSVRKNKK